MRRARYLSAAPFVLCGLFALGCRGSTRPAVADAAALDAATAPDASELAPDVGIPPAPADAASLPDASVADAAMPADSAGLDAGGDAGEELIDPSTYPRLGSEEAGHLRWMLQIAAQQLDDYSNFEASNQDDLTAYRYSIAFAVYFLALEQYHKLPAWSEQIQPAMDRLIQKMLQKPVWEYWATTSQGLSNLEPLGTVVPCYPSAHDPVGEKNIMYSGHVGHMVNLYQMLYRDPKWDSPASLEFRWDATEAYDYDNPSLEQGMHDQMVAATYHSVCCEPNAVFPECNQHNVLSFVLYDATHGTSLAEVNDLFLQFFLSAPMLDPSTHEVAMLYLVKQGWVVSEANPRYGNMVDAVLVPAVQSGAVTLESSSADGWTGAFMHAWQPDLIEQQYPFWKARHLTVKADGTAVLNDENWEPTNRYAFFALLAAELGDDQTRDQLLAYADAHYAPVWQGGGFHYPFDTTRSCTNLTDRLLAMARANPLDGLLTMHTRPFGAAHFLQPRLASVPFPDVVPRRAIWDEARQALVVGTTPGTGATGDATFQIQQLDPSRSYSLSVDRNTPQVITGQPAVTVKVRVDQPHDLVLQAR